MGTKKKVTKKTAGGYTCSTLAKLLDVDEDLVLEISGAGGLEEDLSKDQIMLVLKQCEDDNEAASALLKVLSKSPAKKAAKPLHAGGRNLCPAMRQ